MIICEHGSLKRKCQICYLEEEIRELHQALREVKKLVPKGGSRHGRPDYIMSMSLDKVAQLHLIIEKALGEG